jgi:hypothetical protein
VLAAPAALAYAPHLLIWSADAGATTPRSVLLGSGRPTHLAGTARASTPEGERPAVHYLLIAFGVAVNVASSVVAARIAPRRGADAADWSFLALVLGPVMILWLLLFGGRNRSRVPWLRRRTG